MKVLLLTRKKWKLLLCSGLACFLCAFFALHSLSSVMVVGQKKLVPICRVQTPQKRIAISFDVIQNYDETYILIDILNKYHVKATFFITGEWVDKHPDEVKALFMAGHEICNHSNTHPHMSRLYRDEMIQELLSCNKKITELTGVTPSLFRPPYGDYNHTLLEVAQRMKMYAVKWDIDSFDWKNHSPQKIYSYVIGKTKPGTIILFHNGAKNTPAALPKILEWMQAEEYTIVPVAELIYKDNYYVDSEGTQIHIKGE